MTLTQPLQKDYGTESTWLTMPENVVRVYRSLLLPNRMGELVLNNHFDGMQYAIKNAVMMVTMTERDDIDVTMSNNATIPDESGRKRCPSSFMTNMRADLVIRRRSMI